MIIIAVAVIIQFFPIVKVKMQGLPFSLLSLDGWCPQIQKKRRGKKRKLFLHSIQPNVSSKNIAIGSLVARSLVDLVVESFSL